ncbi:MAG: CRISPR-associated protein Cas5, partial [Thermobifida fusca]|nr:CRISPR-associated protein Cas5 [Thermobifida fusca]
MSDALPAVRVELFAPVASFRDPMFPGVTRCLPVPPLSTVRGLLAAAVGELGYAPPVGIAAHAEGYGTEL